MLRAPLKSSDVLSQSLVSPSARDINATSYDTNLYIDRDRSHVWIGYVTGNLVPVLFDADINLETGTLSNPRETALAISSTDDSHNLIAVGIDPQGYIHVVWDLHGNPLKYKRSTTPYDPATLIDSPMAGNQSDAITYPRFYRAGSRFYFLARDGYSGNGDVYIKELDTITGEWFDRAYPLIAGGGTTNPYLGVCWPNDNGDLDILWTHRRGWLNEGLYYARLDSASSRWTNSAGDELSLPLSQSINEIILNPSDRTVTNSGHTIARGSDDTLHVAYYRHRNGYREIFYARKSPTDSTWHEQQISNLTAPRLRACPIGPDLAEPRPCDMEIMNPTLIIDNDHLTLLYTQAVQTSRGVFARPAGRLYRAVSDGLDPVWTIDEISESVPTLGSEFSRDSGNLPYVLRQESGQDGIGSLYVAKVLMPRQGMILDIKTINAIDAIYPLSLTGDLHLPSDFSIDIAVRPRAASLPMSLIDKGGMVGNREFRVLLWGANLGDGFKYHPDRVQVLIGNGAGSWGLHWTPTAIVEPGMVSNIVLESRSGMITLKINGQVIGDPIPYPDSIKHGSAPLLIGAALGSNGEIVYPFKGDIDIRIYAL